MRQRLESAGRWMLRHPAHWLAPVAAVLLLVGWIDGEVSRGPWPEFLAFLLPAAVLLGVAPWWPVVSLVLMVALPAAQLLGLVVGPTGTTWPVFLAIPLAAVVLGATATGRARRWTLATGVVSMLACAFLLAAPGENGSWAQWTGYMVFGETPPPWRTNPHEQDLVFLGLVGIALFVLAWAFGTLLRAAATGRLARLGALLADPSTPRPVAPAHVTITGLTPRELEIYALVARGLSNAEIASSEHITEATVKTHVSAILRKLELRSRTQLAAHARDHKGDRTVTLDA